MVMFTDNFAVGLDPVKKDQASICFSELYTYISTDAMNHQGLSSTTTYYYYSL